MVLGRYDNETWLGSGADFADAGALSQAGVRIAIFVGTAHSYAHTDGVLHLAARLPAPAAAHDAALKTLVQLLLKAPVAMCGDTADPDFALLLAAMVAEKSPLSFQAALNVLKPRGINLDKNPAAVDQGKRIWP